MHTIRIISAKFGQKAAAKNNRGSARALCSPTAAAHVFLLTALHFVIAAESHKFKLFAISWAHDKTNITSRGAGERMNEKKIAFHDTGEKRDAHRILFAAALSKN